MFTNKFVLVRSKIFFFSFFFFFFFFCNQIRSIGRNIFVKWNKEEISCTMWLHIGILDKFTNN